MGVIQWLLDSDPSIRWQVMRDLIAEPDTTVERERSATTNRTGGNGQRNAPRAARINANPGAIPRGLQVCCKQTYPRPPACSQQAPARNGKSFLH